MAAGNVGDLCRTAGCEVAIAEKVAAMAISGMPHFISKSKNMISWCVAML